MTFSHYVEKSIFILCEDIASPISLSVAILLKNKEWDQLANLRVDPNNYLFPEEYWRDCQALSLLRKCEDLPTSFDRQADAIRNFSLCEQACFRSNVRLYPYLEGFSNPLVDMGVLEFFSKARKIVSDILGPCPDIVVGRFGPGATYGDKGVYTTLPDKISSNPTYTRDAWPFLVPWTGTLWAKACASSRKSPQRVRGNRFLTVPKDATKFRGIAVEPSINVFYQLAYGKVIRKRLLRRGVNLDNGQGTHRYLARVSSSDDSLATLDLSNASDTVCKSLVQLLLPPKWFEVLNELRSTHTRMPDGRWTFLEKFSSMGNGFTFELETLIFLSLSAAVCGEERIGHDVFAYGDDIIIPSSHSRSVTSVLDFCGFSVNSSKSFSRGNFRESCGGDFFLGRAVRPYFLKESPSQPQQIIAFMNGLRRSCDGNFSREFIIRRAWLTLLQELPSHLRNLRGPSALGDLVVHDDPSTWTTRWRHGVRWLRCYRPARFKKIGLWGFSDDAILASATYGMRYGDGRIIGRDSVSGYKVGWVPFS